MIGNKQIIQILMIFTYLNVLSSQTTEVIKKTNIYSTPNDPKSVLGRINPGVKIQKLKKDDTGQFVMATVEFYIPVEALKEGRVAKRIGESQIADDAVIKLISAQRKGAEIFLTLDVTNKGQIDMDISALLLMNVVGKGENIGNLEFMRSKNSVGTIKPGKTLRLELVYTFKKAPKDVELVFQSKLGGDQVFFLLGF